MELDDISISGLVSLVNLDLRNPGVFAWLISWDKIDGSNSPIVARVDAPQYWVLIRHEATSTCYVNEVFALSIYMLFSMPKVYTCY